MGESKQGGKDPDTDMVNESEEKVHSEDKEEMELIDLDLQSLMAAWRKQDPNSIHK
jgi:hypothetical protein